MSELNQGCCAGQADDTDKGAGVGHADSAGQAAGAGHADGTDTMQRKSCGPG